MRRFLATQESNQQIQPAASVHHAGRSVGRNDLRSSILHWQRTLGNQAVQRLLKSGAIQAKLTMSTPGDIYEREADRVADRVMRSPEPEAEHVCACGGRCPECQKRELVQAKGPGEGTVPLDQPLVEAALQTSGEPLDPVNKTFMEARFGQEFGRVRVHSDRRAADSASSISARAYTTGEHIVFGEGEYAPASERGRWLLAHELTHVVQQTSGQAGSAPTNGVLQRAPTISIVPEGMQTALKTTERRAAKSCPITCCDKTLGTLHAMPLFFHQSRGAVVAGGSAAATGIGAELHFIADATQPKAGELCHCNDFRMIQVLTSNVPDDSRGKNNFVDNNASATPFYGDVYLSGKGEHEIPAGYVDAGEKVKTTESIYDRPYRRLAELGTTSLSWMAETCVSCIKDPKPDRVLGCVTYGFTQNYNKSTSSFDPVAAVAPACLAKPSANFVNTLSTDTSTTGYKFKSAPEADECNPPKKKTK